MSRQQTQLATNSTTNQRLWIDGVGGFLLCSSESMTVGSSSSADFAIRAPLSRQHATFHWNSENWSWWLNHTPQETAQQLDRNSGELDLGEGVVLDFRQSHPWSQSAALKLKSSHRPQLGVDGCILMRRECLLGPTDDCHIRCPEWNETIVLSRIDFDFRWHRLCDVHPASQFHERRPLRLNESQTLRTDQSNEIQIRIENLEFSELK